MKGYVLPAILLLIISSVALTGIDGDVANLTNATNQTTDQTPNPDTPEEIPKSSPPKSELPAPIEWERVIIHLENRASTSQLSQLEGLGANIKYNYDIIDAIALSIPSPAANKLESLPFVTRVEKDSVVRPVLDDSLAYLNIPELRSEYGSTGKGILIGVIDTGIDNNHPDLQNVILEKDFVEEGTDDLYGHGTHVASILAGSGEASGGTYMGLAPEAELIDIKVVNRTGNGILSDLVAGIEYAVDSDADVITVSLGSEVECDGLDAASLAADSAANKGIPVVASAGNLGPEQGAMTTPGCSRKAITVGAADESGNLYSYSSRGPTEDGRTKPDLLAPGVDITAAQAGGGYTTISGTSMATPHVSGTIALVLSEKEFPPSQLKTILKETATDLGFEENTQGAGMLNSYAAYNFVIGTEPENDTERKNPSTAQEASNQTMEAGYVDEVSKIEEIEENSEEYYKITGKKGSEDVEIWIDKETGDFVPAKDFEESDQLLLMLALIALIIFIAIVIVLLR